MRGIRVSLSLLRLSLPSKRGIINFFLLSLSIPPNTQTWLRSLPWLYFRLTKRLSSISTTTPSPPIGSWFPTQLISTSLHIDLQSTLVFMQISSSSLAARCSHILLKNMVINIISLSVGSLMRCKKLPFLSLTLKLHRFLLLVCGIGTVLLQIQTLFGEVKWEQGVWQRGQTTSVGSTPWALRIEDIWK